MEYTPLSGGWLRADSEHGLIVYVKVDKLDTGRLVVSQLYMLAVEDQEDEPRVRPLLRGTDLRAFNVAAVEAAANGPLRDALLEKIDRKVRLAFTRTPEPVGPAVEAAPASAAVSIPEGRVYGDGFYRQVAEVYGRLSVTSNRPAADIAEANGVPVRTVHRWIYEARRRGLLAEGGRGKVS